MKMNTHKSAGDIFRAAGKTNGQRSFNGHQMKAAMAEQYRAVTAGQEFAPKECATMVSLHPTPQPVSETWQQSVGRLGGLKKAANKRAREEAEAAAEAVNPLAVPPTPLPEQETPAVAVTPKIAAAEISRSTREAEPLTLATPPRSATPAQNRRIRDALDVAYDVDGGRYAANGSDAAVATMLDLPRAWITAVRESMYGPETNAVADAFANDMKALTARIETFQAETLAVLDRLDRDGAELRTAIDAACARAGVAKVAA